MTKAWTPQQQKVIDEVAAGSHLRVDAVAGSGKTTTLVGAVEACPAPGTLILAFNVKIKQELERRLASVPGLDIKTLNGLGHTALSRTLRRRLVVSTNKLGLLTKEATQGAPERWKTVRKLAEQGKLAGIVPRCQMSSTAKPLAPDTLEVWEELAEDVDLEPDSTDIEMARQVLSKSHNAAWAGDIDFIDQLMVPVIWRMPFPQYRRVFVDEAQDLSPINHTMIRRTLPKQLVTVGDPFQAIYLWRGADSESMDRLQAEFKQTKLPLSVCFRCDSLIVEEAQRFVPHIRARKGAPEGEIVHHGAWDPSVFSPGDHVLCRNNAPLVSLAYKLIAQQVSVAMIGRDIGTGLISLIDKLTNKQGDVPLSHLTDRLEGWQATQLANARARADEAKEEQIRDRADSIFAAIESSTAKTSGELRDSLGELFSKKSGKITLSSIHRAKGLEWPRVWHLNGLRQLDRDSQEEMNISYVATTRAQHQLNYIDTRDRKQSS